MVEGAFQKHEAEDKSVVVIVDDNMTRRDGFESSLSNDYAVFSVSGGIDAFRLIHEIAPFQVLIVENDLNGMKGIDIFRFVHESLGNSNTIVKILITDSDWDEYRGETAKMGRIDAALKRPVTPDVLRRKIDQLLARRAKEKREVMRFDVGKTSGFRIEGDPSADIELVNISETGVFLRTLASYPPGSRLALKIILPDGKAHTVQGSIVRKDDEMGGVGVRFLDMENGSRISLARSLSDSIMLRDMEKLKTRYPFLKTDEMVLFENEDKIASLLHEAVRSGTEVVLMRVNQRTPEIMRMTDFQPPFTCRFEGEKLDVKFKTSDLIFVSFQLGYATYNFETVINRFFAEGTRMDCLYPHVVFYSEKRNENRIQPIGDFRIEIPLPYPHSGMIKGHITDISRSGVCFIGDRNAPVLLKGTPIETMSIYEGDKFLWEESGEVRYVTRAGSDSSDEMKYGIQFGIGRMNIQAVQTPDISNPVSDENRENETRKRAKLRRATDLSELSRKSPEVIRLENQQGEEIVGLLNISMPLNHKPVPVVLIPPAFGKTKETLFSLALTLVENFQLQGKPLAVIRFDGVRRKGESYKDPEASEPPYEMLNANISQGARDIQAVLDWLRINPKLKASGVILVSFSLSALETRIVLRNESCRRRIDYWISCMGTLEFRNLMNRVNCGLDLLEQYQLGIKLGVRPVLGNLISVEPYAGDVVDNRVATLDQAREDMRHFDIPITWIYGKHDKWIKPAFVRDVMSVQAAGRREVISVPLGHNARTSREALQLFGIITSLVHRHLHGEMIQPVSPKKRNLEIMLRAEKDRLPPRKLKNRKAYWERYLVGENDLMGFDIFAWSDDYMQMMEDERRALDLETRDRLLDLGGGTGNFIEHMLRSGPPFPSFITIADLVPEAMKHACAKISKLAESLNIRQPIHGVCLDAETNRYLPVQRFLRGEISGFEELADRIENLDLKSAMKIQENYSPRLHRILRGGPLDSVIDDWLRGRFELPEYRIIKDFNMAARFINGGLKGNPSFRRLVFQGDGEKDLHLPFKSGYFNKILLSLVLSYLFNPVETLREIRRIMHPDGLLVLSSMRPDTDASGPFTRVLDKIEAMPAEALPPEWPKARLLDSLRSFLNDAQALTELEEAGAFDFFDPEKLDELLEEAGWEVLRTIQTFGNPPQGYIVVAKMRSSHE